MFYIISTNNERCFNHNAWLTDDQEVRLRDNIDINLNLLLHAYSGVTNLWFWTRLQVYLLTFMAFKPSKELSGWLHQHVSW